ncbi:acidic leucine-rich nuclear phosphoprotein 32 family member A, partial [Tanacetum coccineum]
WFDTSNSVRSKPRCVIKNIIRQILTDKDAYRNQQYILATQARQVFYLEDPARRPLHWKVVEEVHHRKNFLRDIVVEDDQDVIHGGTSSDVALSNEFPDLDDTILNTNDESTEVDVPLDTEVRDDDDFIYDIDDVAHDIGSDDEVDPTDDEFAEVGPACIDVMALSVAPSYHGGDVGGDPPERPNRLLPHQCEGYTCRPKDDLKKGQATWEKQVDWWADPKRVEKLAKNAENKAKKRTSTYQGSKSFARGRHEYFVKKGRYQDLITHWRDKHSHKGVFDNSENEDLYIIRKELADKERCKKAAEEAKQEAKLAKQQSKLANERAARVELDLR